ncbi:S1 family peptidase [Streptomyces avicenniae]|uniref:S1 family peptidase n=1 Tax=Streptomyces avicenniae TaxID=500153 RepID=UPI00069A9DD7|nr:S1 family peptidase [Streptomyces avicenniae]
MIPQRTPLVRRLAATAAALLATVLFLPGQAGAAPAPTPRVYSAAELEAASDAVLDADIGGTAWHVDPASGTVQVLADTTVSAAELAALRERAGDLAGALVVERTPGTFRPHLRGGEPIYSGGGSCTAGFNARSGSGADFVLTAGHCASVGSTWYTDPGLTVPIGPVTGSVFPIDDYAVIRYTNPAVPRPGSVVCNGLDIDITGPANPTVGQLVWFSGPSGCRSGQIQAVNQTVNYGNGLLVYGITRTSICVEPGDSGGPLFTRTGTGGTVGRALGVLSGGSGNCTVGGVSIFQPVNEILAVYGLTLT